MPQSLLATNIIVGIGASAGGLEALQELIKNLPDSDKMGYVVAQHLSPTYKSMLVELLGKNSPLEVLEAMDGQTVEAKKIYIAPPNKNIFLVGDSIALKTPQDNFVGPKPSIDLFFASLASSKRHEAVGIILSGTGTDGSRGCAQIKAEGGITIAQDPKSAKYDGMPASAIHAGQIDIVLAAEQIGAELEEIEKYISGEIALQSITMRSKDDLSRIFYRLRETHNVDFSEYKLTTINRRIKRRMSALKISRVDEYIELLYKDKHESESLYRDFLIGVTSFFRDKEAFDDLYLELEKLIISKAGNDTIRVWDVGCYTGEEAYSVAIVIAEILAVRGIHKEVQIFATDIDDSATQVARQGIYPSASLTDMPSELIKKYFIPKNDSHQVSKTIRDMIIFSRHDIVKDPPFTRLDIVVCRNLLIYFNATLQERIMPIFHYSILNNGLLFLGKSESIGSYQNLFTPLSKNTKLYRREFSANNEPPKNIKLYRPSINAKDQQAELSVILPKKSIRESLLESLGEYFLPLSIVINEGMDIVFVKEKNPYLHYAPGAATANIFKSIHEELSLELRTLLHACSKTQQYQVGVFHRLNLFVGIDRLVRLVVMPLGHYFENSKLFVISLQEEQPDVFDYSHVKNSDGVSSEEAQRLEAELVRMKMHLQTVIEELETSNEELQSLNEEMQSSNEELQSTNEELETTNEELQSTNEELQIAYAELRSVADEREERQRQVESLNKILNERQLLLQGILDSSLGAIMAFDAVYDEMVGAHIFKCILANRRCFDFLGMAVEELVDKSLGQMPAGVFGDIFLSNAKAVVQDSKPIEFEYKINLGDKSKWYKVGMMTFQNGFVASFDDITKMHETIEDLSIKDERIEREKLYAEGLMETSNAMLIVMDENGDIVKFNKSAEELTGYSKDEVIGKSWFSVAIPDSTRKEIKKIFSKVLATNHNDYRVHEGKITTKDNRERLISWRNSCSIDPFGKKIVMSFGVDVTDRHLAEEQVKLQKDYLDAIVNSQNTIIVITDGKEIVDTNKAFFDFFDEYQNIEEFKKNHLCVCDLFEKVDRQNFVYDGKDGKGWLELVAEDGEHQVMIKKDSKEHYFIVRLSEFSGDGKKHKIVSFVNVGELEDHRQLLEKQIAEESKKLKIQDQIMIQQGKMAAMGEMLGAIAHQWRQPLNALALTIQDTRQAWNYGELDEKYIKKIELTSMDLIRYMSKTIDDFRDFYRPSTDNKPFYVEDCLFEAIALFDAQLKNNSIKVEQEQKTTKCPELECNKNQLKQVFLNIISNAKDAILEATEKKQLASGILRTRVDCADGKVRISIWDNAEMVDEDVIKRAFEPYFTTKEQGKGTGIGLYMSKVIVEHNMGGEINMKNTDNGVEVTIDLPIKLCKK